MTASTADGRAADSRPRAGLVLDSLILVAAVANLSLSVANVALPEIGKSFDAALPMAIIFVPAHVNETSDPVDNLGGVLSAVLVGALIVAINFLPVPNEQTAAIVLLAVAAVAGVLFVLRQRRATDPLRISMKTSMRGRSDD
jgi:uncharacterized YccA/Bax inhibitor family protein